MANGFYSFNLYNRMINLLEEMSLKHVNNKNYDTGENPQNFLVAKFVVCKYFILKT